MTYMILLMNLLSLYGCGKVFLANGNRLYLIFSYVNAFAIGYFATRGLP